MNFIDTHCHLNFEAFDGKVADVVDQAKKAGVTRFVVPGTDLPTSKKAIDIAEKNDSVYAAVGIHPHHLFEMMGQDTKEIINNLEKLLKPSVIARNLNDEAIPLRLPLRRLADSNDKIVAIGEIGLDRYEYKKTKYESYQIGPEFIELQKELFIAQLIFAVKHNLSVIVHNREAKEDLLSVLTDNWNDHFRNRMVIHCCEPEQDILEFVLDRKIYLGVDGDLTYTPEKQEFIKRVPLDILVLETDSPFLIPEPLRSQKMARRAEPSGRRPNTPSNIPVIAQLVADLKGETLDTVARQTTENALKLFNLT